MLSVINRAKHESLCSYMYIHTYLSSEVLKDGSTVDSGRGSHSAVTGGPHLEMSVDPAHWELQTCPGRSRHCLGLHLGILSCFTSSLKGRRGEGGGGGEKGLTKGSAEGQHGTERHPGAILDSSVIIAAFTAR